ncbi:Slp family lipoprotein [Vibrio sonorensis]|uniref:Slp family lipoprotein n=1 Tax=Vibrio sonorensis TaxID=1004316 RepID=UPI0008D9763E|nr:Slp family lipoprotein [Vibrio sonorensis]
MKQIFPRFVFILFITAAMSACSSLPENLTSSNKEIITNYQSWLETSQEAESELRLGGVIAQVDNLADSTRIEIVNLPINSSGKPDINQEPNGRYVVYYQGFADPVTLDKGRLITVLGKAKGVEKGMVGEFEYTFPTMTSNDYHMWRVEERVLVNELDSYYYPCRGFYCRGSFGTRHGKVIKEVR